jgi:uncharacterized protein
MLKICCFYILWGLCTVGYCFENANNGMLVRISEIEVYPEYIDEYLTYARDVAQASVDHEDGVIAIYPMMVIRNNNQIRILEIYKDDKAYQSHIASAHFQKYKQGTIHMVKSLDLVDMNQLLPQALPKVFKKAYF